MKRLELPLVLLLSLAASCGNKEDREETGTADSTAAMASQKSWRDHGITVSIKENSPQFPDAELAMHQPSGTADPGKVRFAYTVKNYDLRAQTTGGDHCANSKDGQHIHLILNNEPYLARYTSGFDEELRPGHYVCLSFLSRSYHESIKNGKAYDLRQFTVGTDSKQPVDLTKPILFYSRPKGEYIGMDAQHILLDFFLVNCDLAPDGYKVKLTVNDSARFVLSQWTPYLIEGMPMGDNTIDLELVDGSGQRVETLYNPTRRTITLKDES
jgi:hypothetical protein